MLLLIPKSMNLDEECVPVSLISNAASQTLHKDQVQNIRQEKTDSENNAFAAAGKPPGTHRILECLVFRSVFAQEQAV